MNYLEIDGKVITTPLWDIVLTIRSQLHNGKLRVVKRQGVNNIRVTCPHHKNGREADADCDIYIGSTLKDSNGDIKVEYGTVKCFACEFKSDFIGFVAECFDEDRDWAKEWLLDNYCDGIVEYRETLMPQIDINSLSKKESSIIDESFFEGLQDYHPYMEKRKITREVAKEFEIKYNPKNQCLVFPVRDESGKLYMFTQRSVVDKTYIIDALKTKPIYLLYYLKQHNIQEAYVCESQINALTLWGHGLPAIALFGTGDKHQWDLLNKSHIRVYNLCFDGDAGGDKGIKEFMEHIRKDVMVNIIRLPRGKDINDLSYEEVENMLNEQLGI